MKQIVVAGAGGFGREVAEYLRQDILAGALPGYTVRGLVDDNAEPEKRAPIPLPYLGSIPEYRPEADDVICIAVGSPEGRRLVQRQLANVGAQFLTYVHSSVFVAQDAVIGTGVIVCPNSIVNSGAVLEDFSVLNVFCSAGHGCRVGAFSVLSPYAALNGNSRIGADCFLATRATIFPWVSLGEKCVVDSHAYVKASVGDKKIISVRGDYSVLDNRLA